MAAYRIAEHLISDAARQVLDGRWQPSRAVIIEFPDMATLKSWYESPEYQPLIELRRGTGTDVLLALDGA